MARKRLGVVIAQLDESNQNLFMQGFLSEAFACDYDVCIFSMFLKYQLSLGREIGDSNIYNLMHNYELFDAIIILGDTVQAPGVFDALEDHIHNNFNGPVLVVDKESKYFPSIATDHYTTMKKLIDHLIDVHYYTDIYFLNGIKGHPHSNQRLAAYLDSLKEHNIDIDENKISYGNYWYGSGEEFAEELLQKGDTLPEAIACANDYMAVGVCSTFAKNGIRVPEDIAVIGYDCAIADNDNLLPLTSAVLPLKELGIHCASLLHEALTNPDAYPENINKRHYNLTDEQIDETIFLNKSCGCKKIQGPKFHLANHQKIYKNFSANFFSYYNHMMDDLLSQVDYEGFFNTVFEYIHFIRDFDSFSLCLNENWDVSESYDTTPIGRGYAKSMNRIIRCGKDANKGNSINFKETFETSCLLPELYDERKTPCAYIFTPLHFNEKCLGYTAISYGNSTKVYDKIYLLWHRNIMQGLECFNRQYALSSLIHNLENAQIRDALTGLYNLRGFNNQIFEQFNNAELSATETYVLAIDMNNLHVINDSYGRREGDKAIVTLSHMISECVTDDEICCRMCNDEFLVAYPYTEKNRNRESEIITSLSQKTQLFNTSSTAEYNIELFYGSQHALISSIESIEQLSNEAVANKNRQKSEYIKKNIATYQITKEDSKNDKIVSDILDNNKLTYHFQPIVSAFNGEVFAYEALMRSKTEVPVSPLTIIKCAERMNRLNDIEKATFTNVLSYIDCNEKYFINNKIFINSLPGHQMSHADMANIHNTLVKYAKNIVIEFTEESEIDDSTLDTFKSHMSKYNIQIAIDDYGAGYSNTNNLLRYMPHYLKIDRMLISDINNNPQKQYFVKSVIEFAHDNDILVLAEGVETSKELKEVISLGIDLIQGFYTSKPTPTPITRINEDIINEIIQYNQAEYSNYDKKEYVTKANEKVSMLQLAIGKYTQIIIPENGAVSCDVDIIGASGFHSSQTIFIEDGFIGNIYLDNISLGCSKHIPCIELGKNVNATIILNGDNELRTGGIRVPESSSLTFKGDGNLSIVSPNGKYYGIGAGVDERHGNLIFDQDGGITINGAGMQGISIGSGLGGIIEIKRGWYKINMNGKKAVGIGSYTGDDIIKVCDCDLDFHFNTAESVAIGSESGDAKIYIHNISAKIWASGQNIVGIGSIDGDTANIHIRGGYITMNMRSHECICIGGGANHSNIEVQFAALIFNTLGDATYAMGTYGNRSKIKCSDCDFNTNISNNVESDFAVNEEDFELINCRCIFKHDDKDIIRTIKNTYESVK